MTPDSYSYLHIPPRHQSCDAACGAAGHTVTITQMHTTNPSLMPADGSPYNYYDVEIVSPGCPDAYDGALGQTYKCTYAGDDLPPPHLVHAQQLVFGRCPVRC